MVRISLLRPVLIFVLLVLLQVVILNSISFFSFAIPLIYIYFLLRLPTSMSQNSILLLGFVLGFSIDIFCNTPGINAAATTLIALIRRTIMKAFFVIDDIIDSEPSIANVGVAPYMKYAFTLILLHMIALVSLEAFSYFNLKLVVIRVICSTLISSLIIFGFEGFGFKKKKTSWRKN